MVTPVSGASTWLTLNNKPLSFQAGSDNLDGHAMEYQKNYLRTTAAAPLSLEIFIDQHQLHTPDYNYGYWEWRPSKYAGLYELRVKVRGYPDQVTKVRVIPQYLTQPLYQKMQDDLSNVAADLLFSLVSSVSERAESVRRLQDTSPLQEYRHIRVLIDSLGPILSAIRRDPYRVLAGTQEQRDWHDVWQFNADTQAIAGDAVHLSARTSGRARSLTLPAQWSILNSAPSYDVYENRLLKQFLRQQLIAKLNSIETHAESELRQRRVRLAYMQKERFHDVENMQREIAALEGVIVHCQDMQQRCLQWSSERYLHGVRGNVSGNKATQVLLKHPEYSRFYQLYLQFQQRLQISLNLQAYITELSLRKIAELYEMWSVFATTRIIIDELQQHGYEPSSQSLFYEIEKDNFHFEVRKNTASIVLAKDEQRVKIIYEPIYPNYNVTHTEALVTTHGRSLPQIPDMAVELYQQNKPRSVCIFDAKYKRERDNDGKFYPLNVDINKMSNYMQNIQYQTYDLASKKFRTRSIVSSAYVLFPGTTVYEEANGKIGGIPLRPDMPPTLQQEARQKIHTLLLEAHIL